MGVLFTSDYSMTPNLSPYNTTAAGAASPPPAYSPRNSRQTQQQQRLVHRQLQLQRLHQFQRRSMGAFVQPVHLDRANLLRGSAMADRPADDDTVSPISMYINTSVHVVNNKNLVALADTPSTHANAISQAVTKALRENSSGQCGIPMIDEDGRPRPLQVHVEAGIIVEGSENIVGSEAAVCSMARQNQSKEQPQAVQRQPDAELSNNGNNSSSGSDQNTASKRRRACT
ncbi:hypothetical protein CDD81_2987 [Ophiocordyceps australis]|uniref:Uncharacterized protein n=1 Tax=Ophiocordyceps australis TaxID=1399860 RepID=A0A2C5XMY9_9HYPO|nr:hypothetical protein CDD81_2987 [Ophiocordyceps australis]